MKNFNDVGSETYKRACGRTKDIEEKLAKTGLSILVSNVKISGSFDDIRNHLKRGPAKNLTNNFFKYTTDKCDCCNISKDETLQLDRAHCNEDGNDRDSLLRKAINSHYVNETTPILVRSILRDYIRFHSGIPLFILCKPCHYTYDNM
ncbi:hypothetical protein N9D80_03520 [Flavobacteriales bacterium]|nr:hypothetical protein [Flavobacteriales bacterium]